MIKVLNQPQQPLIEELINRLRNKHTQAAEFRQIIAELTRFLCYHALADFAMQKRSIDTWNGPQNYPLIDQNQLVLVPILRAGMPMLDGAQALLPDASNGFLAMKRDEVTHIAKTYYNRVPECHGKTVLLLDPMLATGGSLSDAIELIKALGAKRIISLNIIGSPEGIEQIEKHYPEVDVFITQVDNYLDENKFIYPGLGDAGDRAFNTPEN